jgi:carboxyl-terminal processing protease
MSPRGLLWIVVAAFAAALSLRLAGGARKRDEVALLRREQAVFEQVQNTIVEKYVDPVDRQSLFYGSLEGMASSLDSHSSFWPPKKRKAERSSTTGRFGGLGVEIAADEKRGLVILRPLPNTPAAKAGLMPEDRIVKIDGQPAAELSTDDASDLIRGEPGTNIHLTILRPGRAEPLDFDIVRAEIPLQSVQEVLLLAPPESAAARVPPGAPKLGYILLSKFQDNTAADLENALDGLEAQGLEGLVLDLRGNPGGVLDAAIDVCSLFLTEGKVLTIRGRDPDTGKTTEEVKEVRSSLPHKTCPLVLLVDSRSASASEIVAGCLKDRGRAVLVGDKTYGKGSVQTIIPVDLGDWGEAALKLTTARFYTPSDKVINDKGIEPQHVLTFTTEQLIALQRERYRRQVTRDAANGGGIPKQFTRSDLTPEGQPKAAKPAEPFHDLQLEKAIEVLTRQLREGKG